MWHIRGDETVKKEVNLLHRHVGRATPVRPVRLVGLVVVTLWIEVYGGMDEA